jgi:hypothetical protein
MARKKIKRKPGPPARYGYRPTLTIRLQEPLYRTIKKTAAEHGKSISEEIEDRLGTIADSETARAEMTKMLAEAKAVLDAARVQALRVAGLMILREIEGRPTRVIVDLETLLAEADGVARAMRSGFFPGESPPAIEAPRPMTAEEAARASEEIKRTIDEVRTRAADAKAASKSDDEAA